MSTTAPQTLDGFVIDAVHRRGDAQLQHALWTLSVALVISASELGEAVATVWGDAPLAGGTQALEEALLKWPFVRRERQGLRLDHPAAGALAADFRHQEPESFEATHRVLYELEEKRAREVDEDDPWFVRGRLAFYLAGWDQDKSVEGFEEVFVSDPRTMDRHSARMWLTSLVLRQRPLLDRHERETLFFQAFRDYVTERRPEARETFRHVLELGDQDDVVTAIATHLLGVLTVREQTVEAMGLMRRSIKACQAVGLTVGEIMARNSLSWAYVRRARQVPKKRAELLQKASALADENVLRCEAVDDRSLSLWCAYAQSSIGWLKVTRNQSRVPQPAHAAPYSERLVELGDQALAANDLETAARAYNAAAGVNRDVGLFGAALEVIGHALDATSPAPLSASALDHFAKTVGSTLGLASGQTRDVGAALLERIQSVPAHRDDEDVEREDSPGRVI